MSKPSENAQKIIDFLGCPYEYFPAGNNGSAILHAYEDALGKREIGGYTPVVIVTDNTLAEWIDILRDEEMEDGEAPSDYRSRLLSQSPIDPIKWFTDILSRWKAEMGEHWESGVMGELEDGGSNNRLGGFMEFDGRTSKECILAKIPTKNPWEVFAWIPFGGWNECPTPDVMLAVGRHWYEKYNAIPAVITHDVLELSAQPLLNNEMAMGVALEQFAFCPDLVFQGVESVGRLAGMLTKSSVWYFWWD